MRLAVPIETRVCFALRIHYAAYLRTMTGAWDFGSGSSADRTALMASAAQHCVRARELAAILSERAEIEEVIEWAVTVAVTLGTQNGALNDEAPACRMPLWAPLGPLRPPLGQPPLLGTQNVEWQQDRLNRYLTEAAQ
jgi:hypothetical protein